MKRKKIIGLVLALAMVLGSTMTAFAEQGDKTLTGEELSGSGDVKYVDTIVYKVTLPTSAALGTLMVDPQGLTHMDVDSTATLEELDEYAGRIWTTKKPVVSNKGSVDTKVTISLKVDTTGATVLTDVDSVDVSTGNTIPKNIALYAIPSAEDVKGADDEGNPNNYVASTVGLPIDSTGVNLSFVLPKADYVVKRSVSDGDDVFEYILKEADDPGHGTAISIEGKANKFADWSDFTGKTPASTIAVKATFSFDYDLGGAEAVANGPYGMVETNGTITVESFAEAAGAGGIQITGATKSGDLYTTTFTPGTAKTLTVVDQTVKAVKWGADANAIEKTSSNISYTGSSVKIASGMWAGQSGATKYLAITLSDNTVLKVKVSVQ